MVDKALLDYVKQNLAAGFPEAKIREALKNAGWFDSEIQEAFQKIKQPAVEPAKLPKSGFFGTHNTLITAILILAIILPTLAFGGLWIYQNRKESKSSEKIKGELVTNSQEKEEARRRDLERLAHVKTLQLALQKYFEAHSEFPKKLVNLTEKNLLQEVPKDPKTGSEYVYNTFGSPRLYYSLTLLLETSIGTLNDGMQIVSSDSLWPVDNLLFQESVLRGERLEELGQNLVISAFAAESAKPNEEVVAEISGEGLDLQTAVLVSNHLKLIDSRSPFRFSFSAPPLPGSYEVKFFAFDDSGKGYYQTATLNVTEGR